MKKHTTLKKGLGMYSALAGSIIAIPWPAQSQVIYTDVDPDIFLEAVDGWVVTQDLDLNNDGTTDFQFEIFEDIYYFPICSSYNSVKVEPYNFNAIANLAWNTVFDAGDTIDNNLAWEQNKILMAMRWRISENCWTSTTWSYGEWLDTDEKFMGLRFNLNGNQHYGWVRLTTDYDFIIIHDYAYEATPNIPILAGDTGCSTLTTYYADSDNDGFGISNNLIVACSQPTGYVTNTTDCNDANAAINPAAIEICDGIDNNCDGAIDPLYTFYADADGDGYGNNNSSVTDCTPPSGYVTNNTDCNDAEATIHPGAAELCNDIDDNCNAQVDEGLLITFYADADGDLYGNANNSTLACTLPNGYVTNNTDCDDSNANIYPGAPEILFNGIDDDCDGYVDEFGTDIYSSANTASAFSLFPNPTNGEFVVYLQLNNEKNAAAKIEVINLLGQVVYNKTSALMKGKLEEVINLNDEADGMYMVRVMLNDRVYTAQIHLQK